MTKEELKKEAVKYGVNNCGDCYGCHKKYRKNKNCERLKSMTKTYLASAEPREKRIAELEKENKVLTQNLEDSEIIIADLKEEVNKVAFENGELKAQIEKMKRCYNCDFMFSDGNCYYGEECKNKDHWKLRR